MTPLDAVISIVPMLSVLIFMLSWLVQTLTRIENRVTRLETIMDHPSRMGGQEQLSRESLTAAD